MIPMLFALATTAVAGRHELSYEYGYTGGEAPMASLVGLERPHAFGLRAGVSALRLDNGLGLVVLASWDRTPSPRSYGVELFRGTLDRWGVGAKLDGELFGFLFPYGRVEARLVHGATRVRNTEGSDGRYLGVAPAGLFTGGIELMIPDQRLPVTAALYIEGGYEVHGDLRLAELGSINLGGPVLRSGIGLRF
jgi:hypothetical protein